MEATCAVQVPLTRRMHGHCSGMSWIRLADRMPRGASYILASKVLPQQPKRLCGSSAFQLLRDMHNYGLSPLTLQQRGCVHAIRQNVMLHAHHALPHPATIVNADTPALLTATIADAACGLNGQSRPAVARSARLGCAPYVLDVCMGSEPAAGCSQVSLRPQVRHLAAGILLRRLFHHRRWRALGGRRRALGGRRWALGGRRWPLGGRRRALGRRRWPLGGRRRALGGRRRALGRRRRQPLDRRGGWRGPPWRRQATLDYLVDALAGAGLVRFCECFRRLGDAGAVGAPPEVGVLAAGLLAGLQQAPAHAGQLAAAIGWRGGGVGWEAQSADCSKENKSWSAGAASVLGLGSFSSISCPVQ